MKLINQEIGVKFLFKQKFCYVLLVVFLGITNPVLAGRCTGSSNCTACSSCNYCKHCNSGGGSCGVCGGGSNYIGSDSSGSKTKKSHWFLWALGIGLPSYWLYQYFRGRNKMK